MIRIEKLSDTHWKFIDKYDDYLEVSVDGKKVVFSSVDEDEEIIKEFDAEEARELRDFLTKLIDHIEARNSPS